MISSRTKPWTQLPNEPRVLVAQTRADLRSRLAYAFQRERWIVTVAANAMEVLQIAAGKVLDPSRQPVDLLVTDTALADTGIAGSVLHARRGRRLPTIVTALLGEPAAIPIASWPAEILALFEEPFEVEDLLTVAMNFGALLPPVRQLHERSVARLVERRTTCVAFCDADRQRPSQDAAVPRVVGPSADPVSRLKTR